MDEPVPPSPRYRLSDQVLWEHITQESVLLDLGAGVYYNLNASGTAMLSLLAAGASAAEVALALADQLDAPLDRLERDAEAFAVALADLGILCPASLPASEEPK